MGISWALSFVPPNHNIKRVLGKGEDTPTETILLALKMRGKALASKVSP